MQNKRKRLVPMVVMAFVLCATAAVSGGCSSDKKQGAAHVADTPRVAEASVAKPAPTEDATEVPVETLLPEPTEQSTEEPTEQPIEEPAEQPTETPGAQSPLPTGENQTDEQQTAAVVAAVSSLPNEAYSWYFNPNSEHMPPTAQTKVDLEQYDAYYLGNTDEKVIYLTFDEGYENGYTAKILDVLKEKNVPATFFIVDSYLEKNVDLCVRMAEEGHTVGNHSVNHYSMPTLSDADAVYEITHVAAHYKELTGHDMAKFFRPPKGEYSERTLGIAKQLGYKTIFWSFAHMDWDVKKQPGRDAAYNIVMKRTHNGCIMLLHAVSESNTQALPDIIDSLRNEGYVFKSLDEL